LLSRIAESNAEEVQTLTAQLHERQQALARADELARKEASRRAELESALRPKVRRFTLGDDVLFDCDFDAS